MYIWGALDITWIQWYKTRIIMVSSRIYRTSHCYLDSNPSISQSPRLLKYILVFAALIELIFFHFQHKLQVFRRFTWFFTLFIVFCCCFILQTCLNKNTGNGKLEDNAAYWRLGQILASGCCLTLSETVVSGLIHY